MKRPDRFERLVLKALAIPDGPQGVVGVWLTGAEVVALLRKEHRAVVRLVHRLRLRARKSAFATVLAKKRPDWYDAKIEVLDDLLAAMQRRQQP